MDRKIKNMIHNSIIFNKNDIYEWYNIVSPILNHPEFQKRKKFSHHGHKSVYDHSLIVSIKAYFFAKKFNLDCRTLRLQVYFTIFIVNLGWMIWRLNLFLRGMLLLMQKML